MIDTIHTYRTVAKKETWFERNLDTLVIGFALIGLVHCVGLLTKGLIWITKIL